MDPIIQMIMKMLGTGGSGGGLFGGLGTPASPGGISPQMLQYLPLLAQQLGIPEDQLLPMLMGSATPAGGSNPGLLTSLGGALDPSNPMTGLLKLVAGGSMIPFAMKGESAIDQGMSLLQDPSKFMSLVSSLAKPLNKNLVKAVQSGAQGSAAEAGLGQS